jgi:acetyltransferase-like isoleucine patch superfamily enzyme
MELPDFIHYVMKTIDGIITPLILFVEKLVFVDSPNDVIFGRIRGLIIKPFVKCDSIPYIGTGVYFVELLTREYKFGNKVVIFNNCKFHGPIEIGNGVFLNYDVEIRSHTKIGNNVSIGPGTLIISDTHKLGGCERRAGERVFNKIVIEDGCWIGANVTILGGVTIGKGSVIGAGMIISKDIPNNTKITVNGITQWVPLQK